LKPGISVIEIDTNINDPIFADRATRVFLELSGASGAMASGTHGSQGSLI
jgi:hypothetical protein